MSSRTVQERVTTKYTKHTKKNARVERFDPLQRVRGCRGALFSPEIEPVKLRFGTSVLKRVLMKSGGQMVRGYRLLILMAVVVLVLPSPAQAYIGPGAGFALAGSFLAVFAAILSAVLMLLTWPVRLVARVFFRRRRPARARVKRVVIL